MSIQDLDISQFFFNVNSVVHDIHCILTSYVPLKTLVARIFCKIYENLLLLIHYKI